MVLCSDSLDGTQHRSARKKLVKKYQQLQQHCQQVLQQFATTQQQCSQLQSQASTQAQDVATHKAR